MAPAFHKSLSCFILVNNANRKFSKSSFRLLLNVFAGRKVGGVGILMVEESGLIAEFNLVQQTVAKKCTFAKEKKNINKK